LNLLKVIPHAGFQPVGVPVIDTPGIASGQAGAFGGFNAPH
jgi:hypothetical protein